MMSFELSNCENLYHRYQLGDQIVVTQAGREIVTDEEHHNWHHPHAHKLHRLGRRIVRIRLLGHRELAVCEHHHGHQIMPRIILSQDLMEIMIESIKYAPLPHHHQDDKLGRDDS